MQPRKYSHTHTTKPGRGDWILAGGLLVELIGTLEPVRSYLGDKRQSWVAVGVEGSLVEVQLFQGFESVIWESYFDDGDFVSADDAQTALLFGELNA